MGLTEDVVVGVAGLGAMGSRLARNLLADGHRVVVANRTSAAVRELAAAGAVAAASPGEVAGAVDVVLVAVRDDDASRAVWDDLLARARPGLLGVECSTVTPARARELAGSAAEAGVRFVEAPMVGSRPQVEARALVHLAGGAEEDVAAVRDVLAVSAARVHHCGAVGTAATAKLVVNALLAVQVAGLAELLGVAHRAGLDAAAALDLLAGLPVTSPAAARAGAAMLAPPAGPNFPVELVAKDLGYLADLAASVGADAPLAGAALAGFRRLDAAGRGAEDLTAVGAAFLAPGGVAGAARG
jgi:3-hydroxyisobutyrate dehydrogenase